MPRGTAALRVKISLLVLYTIQQNEPGLLNKAGLCLHPVSVFKRTTTGPLIIYRLMGVRGVWYVKNELKISHAPLSNCHISMDPSPLQIDTAILCTPSTTAPPLLKTPIISSAVELDFKQIAGTRL